MTIETALAIVVGAAWACYLVWKWQEEVVDMAVPPYQEPVPETKKVETEPKIVLAPKAAWPFPTEKP